MRVRVPHIHIGDNLALIKAMRLANVQTFGSNVWRPNINLSAPQIDFSCGADRKMVFFYVYLRNITKKSPFWCRYTDKKIIRWLSFEFLQVRREKVQHRPMRICVSVYFLKFFPIGAHPVSATGRYRHSVWTATQTNYGSSIQGGWY